MGSKIKSPNLTNDDNRIIKEDISCDRLQEALLQCHRRMPEGPARRSGCRHLNKAFAECVVAEACPEESEAVRSLCSSGGTSLKRKQCEDAQLSLSLCLSRHQREFEQR
ncbi:hypothetical protein ARALYDRAFT_313968 [Arabidopsis lyrata subsp. lyrata]|uniref:COX assembly mitochondrial protein n=1 Tax=Arabidopsis lyrata subsp. lyrata TaxID=81972 RepID=D7KKA0_ARALL|nr:hypothetical protein ARALYDRAFT_313968 [Arabidopsis lyrata subsp. lyrata]